MPRHPFVSDARTVSALQWRRWWRLVGRQEVQLGGRGSEDNGEELVSGAGQLVAEGYSHVHVEHFHEAA